MTNCLGMSCGGHCKSTKYIALIKDIYDNVVTSVQTNDGDR
jgi:hypothetical protein